MGQRFLSDRWFRSITSVLSGETAGEALQHVEHQWTHSDGSTEVHTQAYDAEGRLRSWHPGSAGKPDLCILGDTPALDDLLHGRLHRSNARHILADGVERDILGLPRSPWRYEEFDLGALQCNGRIVCGAGPDRYFQHRIECVGSRIRAFDATADVTISSSGEIRTKPEKHEFRINAPYPALLQWLHTDTLLGHLIRAGFDVGGDLWRVSAIEGLLASTRDQYSSGPERSGVLMRYGVARHHPYTIDVLNRCVRELS